ncbi:flagellar protein export ATPase FliI [Vagococcus carniphilus]|uniref:flagellar protein export ATPase FliI n=1 Tax=Vagococcus carniphilus TaxID=218144 RepID=UPI002890D005|nr:flagellar protein export ATPase FliI [Vagococcus carniphilus]MDT2829614.1 flagellar protein export ATPase FliI [Vagococcus carniphilus]MDT2839073.1 flagellar protein export ATPase FliI [Vagococcus carniphilus]MDT2847637.1 flagellar protein export ATPase FliI [Vagococcus carniphilus]MDT2853131.1 flagellar protein export ATPase FliI [Vagococcus carniphilus]
MTDLIPLEKIKKKLTNQNYFLKYGKVTQVVGLIIKVEGLNVFIGEVCQIEILKSNRQVMAEVVGFVNKTVLLMPLDELDGIGPGCLVKPTGSALEIEINDNLLGQTLDGLGRVLTNNEEISGEKYSVNRESPDPFKRRRIETVMSTGVKAIDGILTVGEGQRLGIFAGSGVGKSTLLGMIARYCEADVIVIGLIGERGREVTEFIENDLGPEGYKKSIIVCATSDQPPLVRLKGAFVATAIAEYYRDQGKKVILMMDSVTRFAMAQREIGLATGEPPTSKGYTPSVFTMLPKLLERSGMSETGSITAFYTVLVEGDDMNEPIADAVRGILDGHVILSRKIAGENQYPAIDIQQSLSRLMKSIVPNEQYNKAGLLKENLAAYAEAKDLIDIGAYKLGTNPKVDQAIQLNEEIKSFLKQNVDEPSTYTETVESLNRVFM